MNKKQWKVYKNILNEKYDYISIKALSPVFYKYKDEIIVRFLQSYSSNLLTDFGEKTLYVKLVNDQYQIVGEEWAPVASDFIAKFNKQSQ